MSTPSPTPVWGPECGFWGSYGCLRTARARRRSCPSCSRRVSGRGIWGCLQWQGLVLKERCHPPTTMPRRDYLMKSKDVESDNFYPITSYYNATNSEVYKNVRRVQVPDLCGGACYWVPDLCRGVCYWVPNLRDVWDFPSGSQFQGRSPKMVPRRKVHEERERSYAGLDIFSHCQLSE